MAPGVGPRKPVRADVGALEGFQSASAREPPCVQEHQGWYLQSDTDGVWTSPDNAKVAWFRDPDGNLLSLVEAP